MKPIDERYSEAAAGSPDAYAALLRNREVRPHWTGEGDCFWYARQTENGETEYIRVDPDTGSRTRLAQAPVLVADDHHPTVDKREFVISPDGTTAVFRRDHNLWLRSLDRPQERPLTSDGEPGFSWGRIMDNNMMHIPMKKQHRQLPPSYTGFSPSSKHLFSARIDERSFPLWPFVEHLPADKAMPTLHQIRARLDDDPTAIQMELAIVHVASGKTTKIPMAARLATGLLTGGVTTVTWNFDETSIYLVMHGIGQEVVELLEIDVETGQSRVAITERAKPMYESNTSLYKPSLIHVLPESNEVVWFSQRDGWGHLYLYDLVSGQCKHRITAGNIVVSDLLRINSRKRELLFLAGCGDHGHNPYWRKLYKAAFDGGQELLTPEPVDHEIAARSIDFFARIFPDTDVPEDPISPSGRYVVDHMSTVDTPPRVVLRRCDGTEPGEVCMELERADASAAYAAGYQPPSMFTVKAADGHTDLWGALYSPQDIPASQPIPVIDLMYAGFQMTRVPTAFLGANNMQSLAAAEGCAYAALGMAAVVVDGRGTPGRDREFRQWTRAHPEATSGLEDHVAAIKNLKSHFPALDLDRVGVVGHSYGGYNSVRATLLFPDFFKVCVSSAGVHVPEKMAKGAWAWHVSDKEEDASTYAALGNLHLVDRLNSKLLILFGNLDENATPDHNYALIQALIAAGKRFDLKIWPDGDHYHRDAYTRMVTWDYFVEHLLGEKLPVSIRPGSTGKATSTV